MPYDSPGHIPQAPICTSQVTFAPSEHLVAPVVLEGACLCVCHQSAAPLPDHWMLEVAHALSIRYRIP